MRVACKLLLGIVAGAAAAGAAAAGVAPADRRFRRLTVGVLAFWRSAGSGDTGVGSDSAFVSSAGSVGGWARRMTYSSFDRPESQT